MVVVVVVAVVVGALPTLQPKTPEATVPQYEPSGRPLCGTGHEPALDVVPMQTGSCAQKMPGTPSTLTELLPLAHDPTAVLIVVVVVLTNVYGAGVGATVGAAVVATGA